MNTLTKIKFLILLFLINSILIFSNQGENLLLRFSPPPNFDRLECERGSFGEFLRTLPLKNAYSDVKLYDGRTKSNKVWSAVFDIPILEKDLIQCADAVIKLRAEYLYQKKEFDKIVFTLTNKMVVPYKKFVEGYRVKINGNRTFWVKTEKEGENRKVFDEYLEFIYNYSGTVSLTYDTFKVKIDEIEIGDIFLKSGNPGHCVIVVDLAKNKSGEKVMLLAQSYMPSQEIHILKSFEPFSPWYKVEDKILKTPEWTFDKGSLRRFK